MNRQLLEVLVSSSVLILALSAMRLVLRGKISPRLQYGLWLLAAVRLLLQVGRRLERYGRPCHSGEDRRLIDRAKALLMDRHGITEEQAHYYLQKKSMDSRTKLAQTARLVLDSKTME